MEAKENLYDIQRGLDICKKAVLIRNYFPAKEIPGLLFRYAGIDRTYEAVRSKVRNLGIETKKPKEIFTKENIERLSKIIKLGKINFISVHFDDTKRILNELLNEKYDEETATERIEGYHSEAIEWLKLRNIEL